MVITTSDSGLSPNNKRRMRKQKAPIATGSRTKVRPKASKKKKKKSES